MRDQEESKQRYGYDEESVNYEELFDKYLNCETLFTVAQVIPDTAGEDAGIIAGDMIIAVDGFCSDDYEGKVREKVRSRDRCVLTNFKRLEGLK